ncbi:hypothetical protein ACQPZF_27055 [Actinosynnema sp. CS-041913]|uniref:hypothetical protein n=1 Tax=Actinosynnema sp. CS-041913 TaxID=3239917 RepID=UPI003D8D21CE
MPDDNLIKPVLATDPDPLTVSTFAEPSYATLTLVYGREKDPAASWPTDCCKLRISIPTGRSATALTGDPQRITPSTGVFTDGTGKRWHVARDSTDPNRTEYTLVPEDNATFDGTWQLDVKLSGIEVNGAIGPVTIELAERTKTAGEEWTERKGHVEVVKRDDVFFLHSLRPADNVISRDGTAQLNWEGSTNAQYTVYYRDKDGEDQAKVLDNPGGTWTSPPLVDATNFTLKATLGDKDLYQTTHVRVADPDVRVHTLGVADKVVSDLVVDTAKTLKVRTLSGGGSAIKVRDDLDQSGTVASITTGTGGFTANGHVSAIAEDKIVYIRELRGGSEEVLKIGSTTEIYRGASLKITGYGRLVTPKAEFTGEVTVTEEGSLTVAGLLSAFGETRLVGGMQSFELEWNTAHKFTAPTSGLAIGIVLSTSIHSNPMLELKTGGVSAQATARRYNTDRGNTYSTTVLPVKRGVDCTVSFVDNGGASGRQGKYAWLRWVPFGDGTISLDPAPAEVDDFDQHDAAEPEPFD